MIPPNSTPPTSTESLCKALEAMASATAAAAAAHAPEWLLYTLVAFCLVTAVALFESCHSGK